jgi:hypothetical protein
MLIKLSVTDEMLPEV